MISGALTPSATSLFAAAAAAHVLAVMSPGPDLAVVCRQTLAHGRGAGIRTALGIGCGILFHVTYGLFGLSWAIAQFPALLTLLKLIGAGLLLGIGCKAIRVQPKLNSVPSMDTQRPALHDFGIGLVTNISNVKAMLFFIALCSSVVAAKPSTQFKLVLGGWMIVITAVWFSLVAITLGHPRVRAALSANAHWIDRVMGAILLALGAVMLISMVI